MRVLYLTNYHNPYRDEFFEPLGRRCDLTVLFEQRADAARDASGSEGEKREYSAFLRRKAAEYTIEATVDAHASVRRGGSR